MSETESKPPLHAVHHHPAVKWILMVAMLCVTGLSLPRQVSAAAPAVQAPTGMQSGGSFTGAFTFVYYIYCTNGANYSSSYSSNLDGTNDFAFYGAADGTLLLSINGGGKGIISSCGDPYNSPSLVADYSVSKNTAAPTPTPTPPPTPAPTPTPIPATPTPNVGSGSSGGSSSGGSSSGGTGHSSGGSSGTPTTGSGTPTSGASQTVTSGAAASPVTLTTTSGSNTATVASGSSATPRPATQTNARPMAKPMSLMKTAMLALASVVLAGLMIAVYICLPWLKRTASQLKIDLAWRVEPVWFRLKTRLKFRHGTLEQRRRGMSQHKFSGRLMAHHHTSYAALAFLLLVTSVLVAAVGGTSHAADSTLSLSVSGPAPVTPATITSPLDGAVVTSAAQTVTGTCGSGLRVELSSNGSFVGSAICDNTAAYHLDITLTPGTNALTALNYDGADQPGPTSSPVTVTYNAPVITVVTATGQVVAVNGVKPAKITVPKNQPTSVAPNLSLSVNRHYYAGLITGTPFTWPVTIVGGVAPYEATIDWGDGDQTAVAPNTLLLNPQHTYNSGGTYRITASVTDHLGRKAAITLVAIVTGNPPIAAITSGPSTPDTTRAVAWPILIGLGLVIFSFWLGERDRLHRRPAFAPSI